MYMGKLYSTLRNIFSPDSRKETYLYITLWLLLFLTPLFSIYMRMSQTGASDTFPREELLFLWRRFAIFLVMFLVHNFLLAPLLVYRQRRILYFTTLAVLMGAFIALQCSSRPHPIDPHGHKAPPTEFDGRPPHDGGGPNHPAPEKFDDWLFDDHDDADMPPRHDMDEHPRHLRPDETHHPPVIIGEHDIVATIIFILMIGMNLGVKLYFRQQKDRDHMMKLENDNLEQQLEYLKYQINPHFLMNTLNNIHALVDIDPEQAKETIVELSKIMRFVLYEGSKQKVPLRQELIFLENYIELMRMRYSDQVDISVSLPDRIPDRDIPPLLLITFVENAFKHGVSYQQQSFINIGISIDEEAADSGKDGENRHHCLHFRCSNSKLPQTQDSHGGVGLQNARRRLDLLYGTTYTLDIDDAGNIYTVTLKLPL